MNCGTDSASFAKSEKYRSTLHKLAAFVAFALALVVASPVWANGDPDPDELLDTLTAEEEARVISMIDEGQDLYDAGEFSKALSVFNELYELFPHPDINYRVALCYERLGEDEMAVQHYRQFLEQVPDAPERGRIEGTIRTLERRIGEASAGVRVETFPVGAQIFVNDPDTAPVGETPQNVQLAPGTTYQLHIQKDGYEPVTRNVSIAEGERELVQVTMSPDGSDPGAETGPRQTSSRDISLWKPIGTVAMAGFGGLSLFLSRGHYNDYREMDNCGTGGISCQAFSQEDLERERNMAIGFGTVGGVAVLGAAVFTTWWVVSASSSGSSLGLIPAQDGVAVSFSGRF